MSNYEKWNRQKSKIVTVFPLSFYNPVMCFAECNIGKENNNVDAVLSTYFEPITTGKKRKRPAFIVQKRNRI